MDRLCLVSLVGDFLFFPNPSQQGVSARRKKEKKNVEEHLAHKLSSKELLFDSWQQASRQMVFERNRAVG